MSRLPRSGTGGCPASAAPPGTWLQRARRAEAMRDAALLVDHANELLLEAQLRELERALEAMQSSISWRITRPLRQIREVREAFRARPELASLSHRRTDPEARRRDRLRDRDSGPRSVCRVRPARDRARRGIGLAGARILVGRDGRTQPQPAARRRRPARRPRGAGARRTRSRSSTTRSLGDKLRCRVRRSAGRRRRLSPAHPACARSPGGRGGRRSATCSCATSTTAAANSPRTHG